MKPIDNIPAELQCMHCKPGTHIEASKDGSPYTYWVCDYYCDMHEGDHADEPCTRKDMHECKVLLVGDDEEELQMKSPCECNVCKPREGKP